MRLLIYEYCSAANMEGELAQAGHTMLRSLVKSFSALPSVQIITVNQTKQIYSPPEIYKRCLTPHVEHAYNAALEQCQAVLLVAPESGGCLLHLTKLAEDQRKDVLGAPSAALAYTCYKQAGLELWRQGGLPVPGSVLLKEALKNFRCVGFAPPYVLKPNCGAGGENIRICSGLPAPMWVATAEEEFLLQEYVAGEALSVSCLVRDGRVLPLSLNRQHLASNGFTCQRVDVLTQDPREAELFNLARLACAAIPFLKGFVGIDLVYGRQGPLLMEINARITLAFSFMKPQMQREIAQALL